MTNDRGWVTVAQADEVASGEMRRIDVGDRTIVLYNVDGELYATDNICTHALAFLSDGWFEAGIIECPLHGGRFDVRTGKALGPPIEVDLAVHPVRIVNRSVQVKLD